MLMLDEIWFCSWTSEADEFSICWRESVERCGNYCFKWSLPMDCVSLAMDGEYIEPERNVDGDRFLLLSSELGLNDEVFMIEY